ncbi:enediyne antibiotic chromoprotein [Streptomyces eurocidicus]|uniref:Macromomycin n=1 Tax=Streptomyces eurocidicus TaxID=66423 RepID=A0A7W8F0Y8_STREU|nr:enediyne antibiotic chromoprotein [Streptomyces eurocidicus]MBB5119103.1 hypothetical protein [Streptomyces eurocidicus]
MTHMSRKSMRAGALVAAAIGATLLVANPATAAAAAITATPASGLTDGQTITVSGAGYTPGSQLGIAECDLDFAKRVACDQATQTQVTVSQDGSFTLSFTVKKNFVGYDMATGKETGVVDASVNQVGIAAVLTGDLGHGVGAAPLSFA